MWHYPLKWMHEEAFWREMTTRTLSALVAAAIIVLGGRSAGLFKQLPWHTVWKAIAASGIWATAISAIAAAVTFLVTLWGDRQATAKAAEAEEGDEGGDDGDDEGGEGGDEKPTP
jgi:hypothetical protein